MNRARPAPPAGYVRFSKDAYVAICASHVERALRAALQRGTLFDYAASHAEARTLTGRGVAYAVPLPGDVERAVVRHNRHGGMLAQLTGDLFAPPTRAPYELAMSTALRERGVPTPEMLGYVLYPAGPFCRADVMTREISNATDLSDVLVTIDADARAAALDATAVLVARLSEARARHHDLNIKNILLKGSHRGLEAFVLDVDRVTLEARTHAVLDQNLARILRSARKWQRERGAPVTEAELDRFARRARDQRSLSASTR